MKKWLIFILILMVLISGCTQQSKILTTNFTCSLTNYSLNYNDKEGILNFIWQDPCNLTKSVDLWIYNYTNQTQLIYHYSNSINPSNINFSYKVPNINDTYLAKTCINHEIFGLDCK